MVNQQDILITDKQQRIIVVTDVVIPDDGSIRTNEHETLEK